MDLSQEQRKPYFATLQEEFAKDLPWLVLYTNQDEYSYTIEHLEFNLTTLSNAAHLPLINIPYLHGR